MGFIVGPVCIRCYPLDPGQPGTWNVIETRKYVWDNWNIAAEIVIDDTAATTNINYYTWGLDLSGSLQGAGGVGGLLVVTKASSSATNAYFAGADANGNVTVYVDDGGTAVVHYAYSAFGETTAKSGSMADDFTHRFSTKPFDVETGYSKYQQRDYIPSLAKWASRDAIGEMGGNNLYALLSNAPISRCDYLGLFDLQDTWLTEWYNNGRKFGIIPDAALRAYLALLVAQVQVWAGDDPWITRFLANYLFGSGDKISLSTKDVKSVKLIEDIYNFRHESEDFFKSPRSIEETTSSDHFVVDGYGYGNLTLGNFRIVYRGEVDPKCNFKGTFRVSDRFDFNRVSWGGRGIQGEFRLRLFTLLTSGIPFDVESEWIRIEQNSKEGMAKWR